MAFLENILGKKDGPIKSYKDFWNWFQKNERVFFKVIKEKGNIEKCFFNKLSPKLKELRDGFYYLTGMFNKNTAELIITADGIIKNIVFVEELVNAAPLIVGWKFTAFKPALDIKDVNVEMSGFIFSDENISFYSNDNPDYPDVIDITIIHNDLTEENKSLIINGAYIFLDNYLGELEFAVSIDNLSVIGKDKAQKELIPIEKLKAYLMWREKEFIEKYEGIRHHIENDKYSGFEAESKTGNSLLAVINTDLLEWDSKASHPWILIAEIKYDGKKNNGIPDDETYKLLDEIENEILAVLNDADGYLCIGRQTGVNIREIYFACKDFRRPSKVLFKIEQAYSNKFGITYDIYKDKYWKTFNRFVNHV